MTQEMEILFLEKIIHWNKVAISRMPSEQPRIEGDKVKGYPIIEYKQSAQYAFDQAKKLEEVMEMFK